jgi:CzcA family heavy metal efflux pump
MLILVLAAAGIRQAIRLPASIFPEVTFPIVKVIADAGEEPAARVMPTMTRPLEEALLRVPGVEQVRSTTSRGSAELSASFRWGSDMQVGLQRAQAATQRVMPDLPPDTRLDVEWMNPASFPILGYALTSSTRSQAELWRLAEYRLKPALIRIPGVSQVQIQGGRRREFRVELDPAALDGRDLSAADVADAIRQEHQVLSAGLTEDNHELYLTLVNGRVAGLDSLAKLAVPLAGGPPAELGELGRVRVADQVSYIRTTADGDSAVLVNLIRQPSANTIAIAQGVDRLMRDQPDLVPADVKWFNSYDQARFVSDSVGGTRDAILIGMVLAALVLFAFLRRLRLTFIAVATMPLTIAIVGLGLSIAGQTVNLMTLAAIAAALGLIADDAIVVIENIDAYRDRHDVADERAAHHGLAEIRGALLGSSLSTTVILLPFALLTGVVGAFFKPLALTMALALAVSFILACVLVPLAVGRFGYRTRERGDAAGSEDRTSDDSEAGARHRFAARLDRGWRHFVRRFVTRGWLASGALVLLIGGAWILYRGIGTDFLPAMDEGAIILDYQTPSGTSITDTDEMLRHAETAIMSVPDVAGYARRTGTELGFFITEPNMGDYVIKLKPRSQRRGIDEVIDDIRRRVADVEPAIRTDFGQLLEDNIGDLTGGSPQPIDIRIFGSDLALLQEKAREVAGVISRVRGVEDVFDGIVVAGPALQIDVDPLAAARYGLTTESIHAQVDAAVTGTVVDQLRVGDRMYDVRVMTDPQAGASGSGIGALRIRGGNAGAGLLPLSRVATIRTGPPETQIDRESLETYVGVTARLSGRDLGGAISEIRQRIDRDVQLGPGMHVRYGGLFEQQQRSFRGLLYVLLAGLVLVSIVLLFEFGDWRAPVVTSLCAAAVLAGVLLALRATSTTLNISSYVGAIMMVGIVGENAIFVINEARIALGRGLDPAEAWVRASRRRLRPVAMTILATAFALLPLAAAIGQGSQLMQPLAIAVIGGFLLSGPIVLLLLPGLYFLLDPEGRLGERAPDTPE